MKQKLLSRGAIAASAVVCMSLFGCSEDVVNIIDDSNLPVVEDGSIDIANGYNVLMVDAQNISQFRHKLGTKKNVTVTFDADSPVKFEIETNESDTTRYLVASQITSEVEGGIKAIDVKLNTNDGSAEKSVKVVLRNIGATDDSGAVLPEYYSLMGRSTNIFNEVGNIKQNILDFSSIRDHVIANLNPVQQALKFEVSGTRYEETMHSLTAHVGLGGLFNKQIKGHKYAFSGSGKFGTKEMRQETKNFEYYLGFYGKRMMEAKMNKDWLLDYVDNGRIYMLLDTTVNYLLNCPGSPTYQRHPNDSIGIRSIYEQYGTHVITQGTFGGLYIWMYVRRENTYDKQIGHDASASIMAKQGNVDAPKTWLQYYVSKQGSPYISADADGSDFTEEYKAATDGTNAFLVTGGSGNVVDINTWEEKIDAMNSSQWVLVSLNASADDTSSDSEDYGLIPLWEFVQDKNSERYIKMKEYWDDYVDSKYVEQTEDKLVLADFRMEIGDYGSHNPEDAKSFADQGPDGKYYVYFPMMANGNFLYTGGDNYAYEDQRGYPAETNQDHFVTGDTQKCHYWYYALGHNSKCNGITDILFDNKSHEGYTPTGHHANEGLSGAIDNNKVYVKTGGSTTKYEDKIKAVGLYNHSNKDTDAGIWRIWATSGGAEMKLPFENQESIDAFNDYWEPQDNDGHTSTEKGSTDFYVGGLATPNDIRIFYQKKELPVQVLSFGDGNTLPIIQHPKKWGE